MKPVIAVTLNAQELPGLVHWRQMFAGLQQYGAVALGVDCGCGPQRMSQLLAHVDGLLISGGGDIDPALYGGDRRDPEIGGVNVVRDGNEVAAFESAWRRRIPTLAICRGAQLVNAVRGGTLFADLARDRPSATQHRRTEEELLTVAHQVTVAADTRLATWLNHRGAMDVNSQHHQGIRDLAPGFVATALSDDGLVEAFEAPDNPVTAIQWHPEIDWSNSEMSRRLLRGFIESCEQSENSDHRQLLTTSC
ncbi:gamma-glutamyl-gamma-aminobutyrate hydrolase family protein [Mycolicibacterium komossense]|uniref:gamma-glutamyl-gamma-aminobutyrate hydrolase family protein n=1 Tax=Mycolicibacterium komossense TaxID=1779 RepID=UPI0021F2C85C|nr:gamma-glutamyl-gamma-aminobutyrate hydrolase family protein [Mycolicibacterium komossense]